MKENILINFIWFILKRLPLLFSSISLISLDTDAIKRINTIMKTKTISGKWEGKNGQMFGNSGKPKGPECLESNYNLHSLHQD